MAQQLGIAAIEKIIPHRFPMLLIDRVLDLKAGKCATAVHSVSFNEGFVQASSVTNPVFPSPLVVEAMAQTGAVALLSEEKFKGKTAYFGGIEKAEFSGQARPGDQLLITTNLIKIRGHIGLGEGTAKVSDKAIARAQLTFMIG